MNEQLSLLPQAKPNHRFYDERGRPRKLLWCSDGVRIAFHKGDRPACPYPDRPPGGVCCLAVVERA